MPYLEVLVRNSAQLTGAMALVSWVVAFGEAAPRLLSGPLCSSGQDAWGFAGHCPACYIAAAMTIATIAIASGRTRARVTATVASAKY